MSEHPVWGVYDLFRTSRLNVKYYSARLNRYESLNTFLEIILLITAPSSSVASLWFWNTPVGELVWKYLGVLAAISIVIKQALQLNKKIKEYHELLNGYIVLENDLHELTELIKQKEKYDKELQNEFKKILKRKGVLAGKYPESMIDKKLKQICEEEVISELPAVRFYIPND